MQLLIFPNSAKLLLIIAARCLHVGSKRFFSCICDKITTPLLYANRIVYYIVNNKDGGFKEIKQPHRKLTNKLKKIKKKITHKKVKFYELIDENITAETAKTEENFKPQISDNFISDRSGVLKLGNLLSDLIISPVKSSKI